jgi:hypothetical protein
MTDSDRPSMIRYFDKHGVEQAVAPLSALTHLNSGDRERDAQHLRDQILRIDSAAKLMAVRADVAIAQARADAAEDAANGLIAQRIESLRQDALKLVHRIDSYERRKVKAELDALPDPEAAGTGDLLSILPPSEPEDRAHLESMISEGRGDAEAQEPAGELPAPIASRARRQLRVPSRPPGGAPGLVA